MIVWIIGMSGAGKTVVATELTSRLRTLNHVCVSLDGDEFRACFQNDLGHDPESRRRNSLRMMEFSLLLERQGVVVVAAIASIFPEHRRALRSRASQYIEVFIDADSDDLARRNAKNVYSSQAATVEPNVIGRDIPFPRPEESDITFFNNFESASIQEMAQVTCGFVVERLSYGA